MRKEAFLASLLAAVGGVLACDSGPVGCPVENTSVTWIASGTIVFGDRRLTFGAEPIVASDGMVACDIPTVRQDVTVPQFSFLTYCTASDGRETQLRASGDEVIPSVDVPMSRLVTIGHGMPLSYSFQGPTCYGAYGSEQGALRELEAVGVVEQPGAHIPDDFWRARNLTLRFVLNPDAETACEAALAPEQIEMELLLEAGPAQVSPEGAASCEGPQE